MNRGTTIGSGRGTAPNDAGPTNLRTSFGGLPGRQTIPEEGQRAMHERVSGKPTSRELMACGVAHAIATRRPVRAFSSRSVSVDDVAPIVRAAMRAADSDRWNVWILSREAIERVRNAVDATADGTPANGCRIQEAIRRDLYDMMGVHFEPVPNAPTMCPECDLFGAPVCVLVTSNRRLDPGAWIEAGMLAETVLLLAQEKGLAGSVQCSFAPALDAIHPALGVGYDQALVCAISLGHEDRARPQATAKPIDLDREHPRIVR